MSRIDYIIATPLHSAGQKIYYFQRKKMLEELGLKAELVSESEKIVFQKLAFFYSLKSGFKFGIQVKKYLEKTRPKTVEFQNNIAAFQDNGIFKKFKTIISFDFPTFFESSKYAYILPWLEKRKFALADILITRSRYAFNRLEREYEGKIVYIPHAENFDEMEDFAIYDKGYAVAYISGFVGGAFEKGLDILVKTWNLYNENHDPNGKLIITGIDGKEAVDYLKSRKIEVPKTISFYGKMERKKLFGLISQSSLLINTARKEPFGRTILEALLLGTPVVATPTHGAKEIIEKIDRKLISESFLPTHVIETMHYCSSNYNKSERLKQFFQKKLSEYRYEKVKMKLKALSV